MDTYLNISNMKQCMKDLLEKYEEMVDVIDKLNVLLRAKAIQLDNQLMNDTEKILLSICADMKRIEKHIVEKTNTKLEASKKIDDIIQHYSERISSNQ